MTTLLVVDDEINIIEGLKNTIKWRLIGIKNVETARNGIEALEVIKNKAVDIIVTDVRMRGMDGIELARNVHNVYPYIKIIVLSGYSEFEYAKSAMAYGVSNYLLKPVNIKELLETVYSARKDIKHKIHEADQSRQVSDQLGLLQERLLLDIIKKNKTKESELIENFKKFHFKKYKYPYNLVKIMLYEDADLENTIHLENETIKNSINRYFCEEDVMNFIIETPQKEIYVIIRWDDNKRSLPISISEWRDCIKKECSLEVKIGISESFNSLIQLGDASEQVDFVLKRVFTEEERDIFFYTTKDILVTTKNNELTLKNIIAEMHKTGRILNEDTINNFFKQINRDNLKDEELIKDLCMNLLNSILLNSLERNVYSLVYDQYIQILQKVKKCKLLSRLKELVFSFVEYVKATNVDQKMDHKSNMIFEVKEFIKNNYSKDLDVNMVSGIINRSPNYFSRIFHELCGETFSEYLNKFRIAKAKELLKNPDTTIYKIAKEVGYQDDRYFVKMFKKITNFTPSEYRNRTREGAKEGY